MRALLPIATARKARAAFGRAACVTLAIVAVSASTVACDSTTATSSPLASTALTDTLPLELSPCEETRLLAWLNAPGLDVEALVHAGVHRRAAQELVAHIAGPDGRSDTADDVLFEGLLDIDAVPYVGPAALEQLQDAVAPYCDDSLVVAA